MGKPLKRGDVAPAAHRLAGLRDADVGTGYFDFEGVVVARDRVSDGEWWLGQQWQPLLTQGGTR